MNSFANPAHEQRAAEIVRELLPDAFLSVSSEILPAIRFYDRVSTTALNAYIGPVLQLYLGHELGLLKKLSAFDYQGVLLIMASNGGVISPEVAMRVPGLTLLSGPAGGPVAGLAYAAGQDFADCITCDMGGTSFDVALIKDGKPLTTVEGEINRLRISWPMLDVVTIGAGGGSIGWIDEVGLLRMGPQSAGADPGPACYGLGGTEPTCSDADLVLGYLDPGFFAGGRITLDREAARAAIGEKDRQAPGHDARGGGGGHVRGHQRQHGLGRARDRRESGLRPPRLPAGDRRRRRSQPRLHDRARAQHPRDPRAQGELDLLRRGHAALGLEARLRAHLPHHPGRPRLDAFPGCVCRDEGRGRRPAGRGGHPRGTGVVPSVARPALHPPVSRGGGRRLFRRDRGRRRLVGRRTLPRRPRCAVWLLPGRHRCRRSSSSTCA